MTEVKQRTRKMQAQVRQMLNVSDVLALVPVSRRTLLRWERKKTFPPARYIGKQKVWFADELGAWQDATGRTGTFSSKR